MTEIPQAECRYGYPFSQLEQMWDAATMQRFNAWFEGQTGAICDSKEYDHDKKGYHETGCGPHGVVAYPWDVDRFLKGGTPLD